MVKSLDESVRVVDTQELDAQRVAAAGTAIAAATEARAAAAEQARADEEARAAAEDPYDSSAWGRAGIDPVKITIQGQSVYTLRTYLNGSPVFLGKYGEIFTFPSTKHLGRWLLENSDHDLAGVSTWQDLIDTANAGELTVEVHPDNSYSFNGIADDIANGTDAVDVKQMAKAYELLADAADWAGDDSLNSLLLANPRMQDYLCLLYTSPSPRDS